jgi:hypothetical protein
MDAERREPGMSDTIKKHDFAPVTDFLGWKVTEDKSYVLLGFKQPNDSEFVLGITPDTLAETIQYLANATAAFPSARGLGEQTSFAMNADGVDVGRTPSTGKYFLRLRLPGGGHLAFNLDRVLAERVLESLAVELGIGPQGPPPGAARN